MLGAQSITLMDGDKVSARNMGTFIRDDVGLYKVDVVRSRLPVPTTVIREFWTPEMSIDADVVFIAVDGNDGVSADGLELRSNIYRTLKDKVQFIVDGRTGGTGFEVYGVSPQNDSVFLKSLDAQAMGRACGDPHHPDVAALCAATMMSTFNSYIRGERYPLRYFFSVEYWQSQLEMS